MTARTATSEMLNPEEKEQQVVGNVAKKVMGVGRDKVAMVGLFLILALILSACSVSASTANISSAKMALDEAGNNPTKVFSPNDQTFYLLAELSNAPEGTTVKAVWIAVDVEGVKPNFKIDESSLTAEESGQITFDLTNEVRGRLGSTRWICSSTMTKSRGARSSSRSNSKRACALLGLAV